jgi:transcriptional regulator with XRE-family HTH domain
MKFGGRLRQLREAKKLSREALSTASGIPFGTIHGYEIGRRAPSLAATVKLARALGVDCSAFADCEDVGGEDEPAKKPAPKKSKK